MENSSKYTTTQGNEEEEEEEDPGPRCEEDDDEEDGEEEEEEEEEEEDAHRPPRAVVGTLQLPGPAWAGGNQDPCQCGARGPLPILPPPGLASKARGGWATTPGNMGAPYLANC